jgi:hypothetical protein
MNSRFFWRAAAVQTVFVGGPFLLLLLLPLRGNPLIDWGVAIGPGVWVLGSLATGRLLKLPLSLTLVSTLTGGVAGAVIGVAVEHYGALPIAIGVFAASCAGYEAPAHAASAGAIADSEAGRSHVSLDDAA